ncbi:MAG TPA: RimK/LysX family protein [Acidimicrobiia bacterium]|nr:RimK/LysX family protein [Acidimicrobiia bacterium]
MKRTVIGWREWVALPLFGVTIKVKVDTGAASASLHAFNLERFTGDGTEMVRFDIHPRQRSAKGATTVEAEVVDERQVRNPGGRAETRPVIRTRLRWAEVIWEAEINLTRRDEMGFRMLLGRKALKNQFVVDPGRSFLGGRPGKEK